MDELDTRNTNIITIAKQEFDRLKEQSAESDLFELTDVRPVLSSSMEDAAQEHIRKESPGGKVSVRAFWMSVSETDKLLREDGMMALHKAERQCMDTYKDEQYQHNQRVRGHGR